MADLDTSTLKTFNRLYPQFIKKYETLIPGASDDITDKINSIIENLNNVGQLTNDVVKNWNTVMNWVLNDGLTQNVSDKITSMYDNGDFTTIIEGTVFTDFSNRLTSAETSLTQRTSQMNSKEINVLYPPVPLTACKGNGIDDDTIALQAIINYASPLGLDVILPPGRYMITGTNKLQLKGNMKLKGSTGTIIDVSNRTGWDNGAFASIIHGDGSLGSAISVTADVALNASTVQLSSTSGLLAGDLILLTSNAVWLGDSTPANVGELVIIKSVDNATQITLTHTAHEPYLVSDSATVYKVTPIENLTIEGITFIGKGSPTVSDNVIGQNGVGIAYGKNITIRDCKFKKIDQVDLELCSCYQFRVENCSFEDDPTPAQAYVQYQCRISSASIYGIIDGVNGLLSRHTVVFGSNVGYNGIQRHVEVINSSAKGTWHAGFNTHNSTEDVTFHNNEAVGCNNGINIRDRFAKVTNNRMIGCGQGIYLTKRVVKAHIINNEIINTTSNAIYMTDSDLDTDVVTDALIIQDNYIDGATQGIYLTSTTNTTEKRSLNIKNNTIRNMVAGGNNSAIRINGKFSGQILGNDIYNGATHGIFLQGTANHIVMRQNYIQKVTRCLNMENTTGYNVFRDNTLVEYTTAIMTGTGTGHDAVIGNNTDFGSAALA